MEPQRATPVPGSAPMLSVLGGIQNNMNKKRVNVLGLIPQFSKSMSCLHIPYQFESMAHWGETLDYIRNSEQINSLMTQKNSLGSLETSHLMIPLDE